MYYDSMYFVPKSDPSKQQRSTLVVLDTVLSFQVVWPENADNMGTAVVKGLMNKVKMAIRPLTAELTHETISVTVTK